MKAESISPDRRPGNYYVSVIDDAKRRAFVSGPYPTHAQALAALPAVRKRGCELDPRGDFCAWGTCRLHDGQPARPGLFERNGIQP